MVRHKEPVMNDVDNVTKSSSFTLTHARETIIITIFLLVNKESQPDAAQNENVIEITGQSSVTPSLPFLNENITSLHKHGCTILCEKKKKQNY